MVEARARTPEGPPQITEMEIDPIELDQIVGWSSGPGYKGPYALRDFIASRAPQAAEAFGISTGQKFIRHVDELTQEELGEVICGRLLRAAQYMQWKYGSPYRNYNNMNDELIERIRAGDPTGLHIVEGNREKIALIENLAMAGKLYPAQPKPPEEEPPPAKSKKLYLAALRKPDDPSRTRLGNLYDKLRAFGHDPYENVATWNGVPIDVLFGFRFEPREEPHSAPKIVHAIGEMRTKLNRPPGEIITTVAHGIIHPEPAVVRHERQFGEILAKADVRINGDRPWDIQIKDPNAYNRILRDGILGAGESYMAGEWDCEDLAELASRVTGEQLEEEFGGNILSMVSLAKDAALENLRAVFDRNAPGRRLAAKHYDLGNDFFRKMLGETMVYSCAIWGNGGWGDGGWEEAKTLEEAEIRKLDIICQKLGLKPGMRMLDIGCGFGSLALFAAYEYGVHVVGIANSPEHIRFAQERRRKLPPEVAARIEFRFEDYRAVSDGPFDRIASVGALEHIDPKTFFKVIDRNLTEDGVALVHTIVNNRSRKTTSDTFITKHIFPGSRLPTSKDIHEPFGPNDTRLVMENVNDYGTNYDRTCMEWFKRFDENWGELKPMFGPDADRFYRMWKFYLLGSAGAFRSRTIGLQQVTLSRGEPITSFGLNWIQFGRHEERGNKITWHLPIKSSSRVFDLVA